MRKQNSMGKIFELSAQLKTLQRPTEEINQLAYVEICKIFPWKQELCVCSAFTTMLHLIYLEGVFDLWDINKRIHSSEFNTRE